MNNEELSDTGLNPGDRVRLTVEGILREIEFPSGCVLIALDDDGSELGIGASDIVAIERVIPLPEGWTSGLSDGHYVAQAHHLRSNRRAVIDPDGELSCWYYSSDELEGHAPMPAAVAKALLEVWDRMQAEAAR